jgi:hypothetical protein
LSALPRALVLAVVLFAVGFVIGRFAGPSLSDGRNAEPRVATGADHAAAGSLIGSGGDGRPSAPDATPPLPRALPAAAAATDATPLDTLVDELRGEPPPAYRRYVIDTLTQKVLAEPGAELALLDRARGERDAEVLAALGDALLGYYRVTLDDRIPRAAREALATETDPARRRGLLRFLGTVPGVDRVVTGFTEHCAAGAAGASMAARLVGTAAEMHDPAVAQRLLEAVSLSAAGAGEVGRVVDLLDAPAAELRRGAVQALGGALGDGRAAAREALVRQVGKDADATVRERAVDALVRLDLADARPVLARLRGIDEELDRRIERYDRILALGITEWRLVQREWNRS